MAMIPMVIEQTGNTERSFDIYSRLLRDRIVFLGMPIDDNVSNLITAQLLVLEHDDPDKPINMYINSPGGSMIGLFAIYDVMQYVRPPVQTICMGMAASAAAVLLAAGSSGKRLALPNSRILIHQPHSQGSQGQAADIAIWAEEVLRQRSLMNEILAKHTGQPVEKIAKDTDRDNIMSSEEAKAYGLIDEIIEPRKLRAIGAFVPEVEGKPNGAK